MKTILGVPVNVRNHSAWRLVWGLGCIVCMSSTVTTFLILGRYRTAVLGLWAAFQTAWLVSRYIFWHFAVKTDGRPNPVVLQKGSHKRFRLLSLAGGISRYLAQIHARTSQSYLQDLHDSRDIAAHVRSARPILNWRDGLCNDSTVRQALSTINKTATVDVDVVAVIGDTMLAGISWVHGSGMSCLDLYDSCLLMFKIGLRTFLVPSARVLSGNAAAIKLPPKDAEAGMSPLFIDKLGPCRSENNGWVYWIPLDSKSWLYIICDLNTLGMHSAELLDSKEVTRRLALGNLWVSVSSVEDLEAYVDRAALLGGVLIEEYLRADTTLAHDDEDYDPRKHQNA